MVWDQFRLTYLTYAVVTSGLLVQRSCTAIGEPFRLRLYLSRLTLGSLTSLKHAGTGVGHAPLPRRRTSLPYIVAYHRQAASFSLSMDNVGDQPVMMSSHFLQAKPSTTTLSPSVTVSPGVAKRIPFSSVLHQNEEVGTNLGGRNMTPPGVSHLGHFDTAPYGTTLAAYPCGSGCDFCTPTAAHR